MNLRSNRGPNPECACAAAAGRTTLLLLLLLLLPTTGGTIPGARFTNV
jgi:hypothetical protein